MSKFIREVRNGMVKIVPYVPFITAIIVSLFLCGLLEECRNIDKYYIDDSEMFRSYRLKELEDSLIKATGKGHIDTVDFERILNK